MDANTNVSVNEIGPTVLEEQSLSNSRNVVETDSNSRAQPGAIQGDHGTSIYEELDSALPRKRRKRSHDFQHGETQNPADQFSRVEMSQSTDSRTENPLAAFSTHISLEMTPQSNVLDSNSLIMNELRVRRKTKRAASSDPHTPSVEKARRKKKAALNPEIHSRADIIAQDSPPLIRPGLYINPPSRTPIARGRRRHRFLIVIKSPLLNGIEWFQNSSPVDRPRYAQPKGKITTLEHGSEPSRSPVPTVLAALRRRSVVHRMGRFPLIVKLKRLKDLEWFKNCPRGEKIAPHGTLEFRSNAVLVDRTKTNWILSSVDHFPKDMPFLKRNLLKALRSRRLLAGQHVHDPPPQFHVVQAQVNDKHPGPVEQIHHPEANVPIISSNPGSLASDPAATPGHRISWGDHQLTPRKSDLPGHFAATEVVNGVALSPRLLSLSPSSARTTPTTDSTIEDTSNAHQPSPIQPKKGTPGRARQISPKQRATILLSIVERSGGAFPGNDEIVQPYKNEIRKIGAITPYPAAVGKAMEHLVNTSQLKKAAFMFRDNKGKLITRYVVCLPSLSFNSAEVKACEEGIIQEYPGIYFPRGVDTGPRLGWDWNDRMLNGTDHSIAKTAPIEQSCEQPDVVGGTESTHLLRHSLPPSSESQIHGPNHVASTSVHTEYGTGKQLQLSDMGLPQSYEILPKASDSIAPPRLGPIRWEIDPLTEQAFENETLREQQILLDDVIAVEQSQTAIRRALPNPSAWILGRIRKVDDTLAHKPGFATCITLTDPVQEYYHNNGTVSTDFACSRYFRPRLRINTNLQRDFENTIPTCIDDIVPRWQEDGAKKIAFANTVDAVQAWEIANTKTLTLPKSLMLPRFINHFLTEDASKIDMETQARSHGVASQRILPMPASIGQRLDPNLPPNPSTLAPNLKLVQPPAPVSDEPSLTNPLPNSRPMPERESLMQAHPYSKPPARTLTAKESQASPGRFRPLNDLLSPAVERQLVMAISLVRLLLGGPARTISWPAVCAMIPNFEMQHLRYRFYCIRKTIAKTFDTAEKILGEAFLEAYSRGELPPIDYDEVESYNWQALMEWALKQRVPMRGSTGLPATHSSLMESFVLKEEGSLDPRVSTENMYRPVGRDANDRLQVMQNVSLTTPLDTFIERGQAISQPPSEKDLARTLVRANVFTPEDRYTSEVAHARLTSFPQDMLDSAIRTLKSTGTIKSDAPRRRDAIVPYRRNFLPDNSFNTVFDQFWSPDILRAAAKYKYVLDSRFEAGMKGHENTPEVPTQSQMMAITSLVASRQIEVRLRVGKQTTDPFAPLNDPDTGLRNRSTWGFMDGGSDTRRIEWNRIVLPMRLVPTKDYVFGNPLPVQPTIPAPHLLPESKDTRIPTWYSIHDELLQDIWEKVLAAVLTIVTTRPRPSEETVVNAMQSKIEEWEIHLVVQWCIETGIMIQDASGIISVKSWWWCVLQ